MQMDEYYLQKHLKEKEFLHKRADYYASMGYWYIPKNPVEILKDNVAKSNREGVLKGQP